MLLPTLLLSLPLLTTAQSPPKAGLLLVQSRPNHPDLSDETFNTWYSTQHIPDMLHSTLTDLVLRYKNTNASAPYPYLALYRLPSVSALQDTKLMSSIPSTSPLLPGKAKGTKGGDYKDVVKLDTQAFARIQTFEGPTPGKKGRGGGLVTSNMEPAEHADAEFDQWYRMQHLDMLSMLKGYRRSTRYTKLDAKSTPRYLAMHEFDSTVIPPEIKIVMGTEWAKKMVGGAKVAGRDTWEFIGEFGKGAAVGEAF